MSGSLVAAIRGEMGRERVSLRRFTHERGEVSEGDAVFEMEASTRSCRSNRRREEEEDGIFYLVDCVDDEDEDDDEDDEDYVAEDGTEDTRRVGA